MDARIEDYLPSPANDRDLAALLMRAFVDEGHTDRANAQRLTAPEELRRRGAIILARAQTPDDRLLGMVILAQPSSPHRQIARPDEAEVQLLAVDPAARGHGIGGRLIDACEAKARALGFGLMVLSTQPAMKAAHRVYERLGYARDEARDWVRADGRRFLVYIKRLAS